MSISTFLVTFLLVFVGYLACVRVVGKPMATYGWWLWKTSPNKYATVWSFLLYPMTHWVLWLKGERFCTDRYTRFEMSVGTAFFAPRVVDTYDDREGTNKEHYIYFVSWLWPLRVLAAACLHVLSMVYVAYHGIHWCVFGPVGKFIVGPVR